MDLASIVQIALAIAALLTAFYTIRLAKSTSRAAEASELNYRLMNFFEIYTMLLHRADNSLRKALALMGNELVTSLESFYSRTPDRLRNHVIAIRNLVQSQSEDLSTDILKKYNLL
jgi:hypothetical protein